MAKNPTVLLAVIDAVGASTLDYLLDHSGRRVCWPNLSRLGLGRVASRRHRGRFGRDAGRTFARAVEQASASADSVIGHREMVGIIDSRTYELFPRGFPLRYIAALEKKIGRKTIFNRMAGGMEAIELNAAEHERSGRPIVYASKCDPLIQIAMNERIISVSDQHAIADAAFELARKMAIPVTRSIARAYVRGDSGDIIRTPNRHDAVLPLEGRTLIDVLFSSGVWTAAVGKTSDLVNAQYHERVKLVDKRFLDPSLDLRFAHPRGKDTNPFVLQGVVNALEAARSLFRPAGTFVFANFVDCDSVYGHTRDVDGALRSIEALDRCLPAIERQLRPGDLMILTADHGMEHRSDYGYHHKEPLPLIIERVGKDCSREFAAPRTGFGLTDLGRLVAREFGCGKDYKVTRV